jgi:2-(1,2-epoxy-1,2-dihydrophenyl)acetyl-CoA isomerase
LAEDIISGMHAEEEVLYDRRDGVAVITLNRPGARNAVTQGLFSAACAVVARAAEDGAGAIVLAGAGGYFCAGVDLKAMLRSAGSEEEAFAGVLAAGNRLSLALAESPLPSVSAVEGGAVGGGLGVALATDVCVVGRGARLSTQYGRVGMTPDVGVSWQLTQRLGPRLAASQLMRSPMLGGEQAVQLGLADVVVDDGSVLEAAVELAGELASRPPHVVAGARALTAAAARDCAGLVEQLELEREWIHRGWKSPHAQAYAAAFAERSSDPSAWSSVSGQPR